MYTLNDAAHALDGEKQIRDFFRGEIGEAGDGADRGDEDVSGEQGLEIYEGKGEST